ncbi:MAG: hypothetical protein JSS98_04935 [Bacteroidetes bacterium]|nr:hypothetical protein [Bacteroidota bacterium]
MPRNDGDGGGNDGAKLGHDGTYRLRAIIKVSSLRAKGKALCSVETLFAKQSHRAVPEITSCLAITVMGVAMTVLSWGMVALAGCDQSSRYRHCEQRGMHCAG